MMPAKDCATGGLHHCRIAPLASRLSDGYIETMSQPTIPKETSKDHSAVLHRYDPRQPVELPAARPVVDEAKPSSSAPASAVATPETPIKSQRPVEIGGPSGPEPTRYGDWERNGRVSDF